MNNPIPLLRRIALLEGISFLVLVGIAMPLKYAMNMPDAVKITGWIHGVLFMVLCVALLRAQVIAKWPWERGLIIFGAALLPFGPFLVDRRMLAYQQEFHERQNQQG